MTASRLIRKLEAEGFLDEGPGPIRLVRVDDLLDRWAAASRDASEEYKMRWIIKRDPAHLYASLRQVFRESVEESPGLSVMMADEERAGVRCCLGLFAAADALGLGIVRGVPPHIFMDRLEQDVLTRMGLRTADPGERPDAIIRIPRRPESLFRALVVKDGLPAADVLQVWLDVSTHPSRGLEQAAELRRRVLGPVFDGN